MNSDQWIWLDCNSGKQPTPSALFLTDAFRHTRFLLETRLADLWLKSEAKSIACNRVCLVKECGAPSDYWSQMIGSIHNSGGRVG